jgi:peptidoglycan/xylan/chitin deacetylase (PgdA/CDA1 family)
MAGLRYTLIGLALKSIAWSRLDRLVAGPLGGRGVILTFHHVRLATDRIFPENALLEITPAFLEAVIRLLRSLSYDIIPLDAVPARLAEPRATGRFAVLTFDDAYADTRDYALPILKRYEAPATVFVCTGFAERTAPLWWLDLEDALRGADAIDLEWAGGHFMHPMRTPSERHAGFKRLYWALRERPEPEARAAIDQLVLKAGIDPLARVARLCMDWAELRDFAREPLITIGAHSVTHARLATLPAIQSQGEITDSKARIEAELGRSIRHFAYPLGDPRSAGIREFAFAQAAGFETGLTTRPGTLFAEHAEHRMALPRLSINGLFQSVEETRALLSGLPSLMFNRGRRLTVS